MRRYLISIFLLTAISCFANEKNCYSSLYEIRDMGFSTYKVKIDLPKETMISLDFKTLKERDVGVEEVLFLDEDENIRGIELTGKGNHPIDRVISKFKKIIPDITLFHSYDFFQEDSSLAVSIGHLKAIGLSSEVIQKALDGDMLFFKSVLIHEFSHAHKSTNQSFNLLGAFKVTDQNQGSILHNAYTNYFGVDESLSYLKQSLVFLRNYNRTKKMDIYDQYFDHLKMSLNFSTRTLELIEKIDLNSVYLEVDEGVTFLVSPLKGENIKFTYDLGVFDKKLSESEKKELLALFPDVIKETKKEILKLQNRAQKLMSSN